jgi:hypothetical protein
MAPKETLEGCMTGPINIPSAQRSRASKEFDERKALRTEMSVHLGEDRDKTVQVCRVASRVVTAPNA